MTHRFTTDLTLSYGGYETTFPLVVHYWHHKAGSVCRCCPPEPEHADEQNAREPIIREAELRRAIDLIRKALGERT